MVQDPAHYAGREQTLVKHLFLTKYLQKAAFMVLQGRALTFNFVDGFAGPWKLSSDAHYADSSFDQSIRTLEPVRDYLAQRGISGRRVRFFFCEKQPRRVEKLKAYAAEQPYDVRVYQGAFEDHLEAIATECRIGFTFTFIDPTGFNVRSLEIARFLQRTRSEFLFNFMADHINRSAGWEGVAAAYGNLLADPEWRAEYEKLPAPLPQQERILILLKRRMKQLGAAEFMPDFQIQHPAMDRVKMRLVLGTRKWQGVDVFRDVEAEVERREYDLRQNRRAPRQMSLLPKGYMAEIEQKRTGVGCRQNRDEAARLACKLLEENGALRFEQLIGPVLEESAIRTTHLKDVLCDLRSEGAVDFPKPSKRHKPKEGMTIRWTGGTVQEFTAARL